MKTGNKLHFIGIGGVSMGALAQLLKAKGLMITGSDVKKINLKNIDTSPQNAEKNLTNCDCVITSCAIKNDDKEVVLAKKLGKKIMQRGELLGQIAEDYNCVISVAGTHGKTSTTEMLAEVLIEANKKPTVHIGGISNKFHNNLLIGKNDYFVTEACEYCNSFLNLKSDVAVVLNTEPEHLDFFGTFQNMKKSFKKFAQNGKVVVANKNCRIKGAITFGDGGTFEAKNITKTKMGFAFDVIKNQKFLKHFTINSINTKNIENALAVVAVCDVLKINLNCVKGALKKFCGVERRCQKLNETPLVFCDYAHHPTEIKNIILSFKSFFKQKIVVCFQPHTYSRTKMLFKEFVEALSVADEVVLFPTYPAREEKKDGVSSKVLFNEIKKIKEKTYFQNNLNALKKVVFKSDNKGKIFLILGAGNLMNYIK